MTVFVVTNDLTAAIMQTVASMEPVEVEKLLDVGLNRKSTVRELNRLHRLKILTVGSWGCQRYVILGTEGRKFLSALKRKRVNIGMVKS